MIELSMLFDMFAYGVLVPALASLLVLLLARRLGGKGTGAARLGGALAIGAGFYAGYAALAWKQELAPLLPNDSWHWLPYLAMLALSAGLLVRVPLVVRWGLRLAVAVLSGWLAFPRLPGLQGTVHLWIAILAATIFILWLALDWLSLHSPGAVLSALLITSFAAGALLELADFGKFAQIAGVLWAALCGCAVLYFRRPERAVAQGLIPGVAVLLPALMLDGYHYASDVKLTPFVLIVAAPLMVGVGALPLVDRLGKGQKLLQIGAVFVPVVLAIALALVGRQE
jgi:hypothetical protein